MIRFLNGFVFALLFVLCDNAQCETTARSSGLIVLYKNGVMLAPTYSQHYTAFAAAVNLSQSCYCEIMLRAAEIKFNTKPPLIPPATLAWQTPTKRENGNLLLPSEIAGYKIRYKLPESTIYNFIDINGNSTLEYKYLGEVGNQIFEIATIDTNGLYSDFATFTKIKM